MCLEIHARSRQNHLVLDENIACLLKFIDFCLSEIFFKPDREDTFFSAIVIGAVLAGRMIPCAFNGALK